MVELGWSIGATIVTTLIVGILVGLFNGLIAVKLEIPAFIVTLGMMFISRSLGDVLTNGDYFYGLPDAFTAVGKATPLGVSWSFWILIALVVLGSFVLRLTIFGSMVTATGGNKQAARVAGINTDAVKIACFVLTSELAMISGILATSFIGTGDSHIGPGMELDVIASTVIGGTSLFGGVGSVIGSFLGTSVLQVIRSGLIMAGINIDWQNVAVGSALAAAASVDLLRRRAKQY
jgi:ribose transport system permease protein